MRSPCTTTKSSPSSLQLKKAHTQQQRPNAAQKIIIKYLKKFLKTTKLIHRNLLHVYTLTKKEQKEKFRKLPYTTASKRMKYLGTNLPKEAKDLYFENYKTLMKEIKDDTNRWKDTLCSWTGRINIVKWLFSPRQSTDSVQSLSKYQWHFSQN